MNKLSELNQRLSPERQVRPGRACKRLCVLSRFSRLNSQRESVSELVRELRLRQHAIPGVAFSTSR